MKGQKQKIGLMIALLFITIGFAALTTVLVINGSVTIGTSKETFDSDVIFTKAKTNTEGMAVIAPDGKSITFATNEITELGQESTLDFSITNKSRIYDADAVIECMMVDEENAYNDYISLTVDPKEFVLPASETKEGNLKVKLIKSYIGEGETIKFSCTISANAIERDGEAGEIVIDPSETNVISGYLFDENNIPVSNANIVIMADKPYYATTDSNGYYEIAGVQTGSYPVYIISSDKTLEEIKEMNNQEIKDNAVGKGQLTTDNMNVSFDNNYKQESSDTVNKYTIIFNANGGNAGALTKEVIENAEIGEFPIITRTGYTFDGWYTEASGGTKVTSTTRVTQNQTLYAQWVPIAYSISYTMNGGTNSSSNPTSYNIASNAISLMAPTKTGYTFAGWTGSNGTTAQTSVTIAKGSIGNKSYTANWTAKTYSVSSLKVAGNPYTGQFWGSSSDKIKFGETKNITLDSWTPGQFNFSYFPNVESFSCTNGYTINSAYVNGSNLVINITNNNSDVAPDCSIIMSK